MWGGDMLRSSLGTREKQTNEREVALALTFQLYTRRRCRLSDDRGGRHDSSSYRRFHLWHRCGDGAFSRCCVIQHWWQGFITVGGHTRCRWRQERTNCLDRKCDASALCACATTARLSHFLYGAVRGFAAVDLVITLRTPFCRYFPELFLMKHKLSNSTQF